MAPLTTRLQHGPDCGCDTCGEYEDRRDPLADVILRPKIDHEYRYTPPPLMKGPQLTAGEIAAREEIREIGRQEHERRSRALDAMLFGPEHQISSDPGIEKLAEFLYVCWADDSSKRQPEWVDVHPTAANGWRQMALKAIRVYWGEP